MPKKHQLLSATSTRSAIKAKRENNSNNTNNSEHSESLNNMDRLFFFMCRMTETNAVIG